MQLTGHEAHKGTTPVVLLIEDNPLNMKVATISLARAGFEVVGSETAERGLELARSLRPDLVLMDLSLPGMDGFEALGLIRADQTLSKMVVVALSAHAMPRDRLRALGAGFDGYITKPIEPRAFVRVVHGHLNRSQAPSVVSAFG